VSRIDSLLRSLRSRRLAVGLIGVVIAYSFIGTLVPQVDRAGGLAVGEWQVANPWLAQVTRVLGLHIAFTSPLFLMAVAALALSTAACAWERTKASLRVLRARGRIGEGEARRLRDRPRLTVPLPAGSANDPLDAASRALRALRLGVRRGPSIVEASSRRVGLLGSPLFHWTLVALFVVVGLGRLSRAEGLIGLPVGYPKADVAQSYQKVSAGPLYPGHSGLTLLATDVRPFTDAEGVQRGVSPSIQLRDGERVLLEQRVYPNGPLRYGTLLIHSSDYGLAAVVSVETSAGVEMLREAQLVDFDDAKPSGTTSARFDLTDSTGRLIEDVSLTVPLDRLDGLPVHQRPKQPRVVMTVDASGAETVTTLAVGQARILSTGDRLRLVDLVYYARVSVADDWSVYPIYALFVLAAIALSLAILVPYRRVLVMTVPSAEGAELHALVRSRRGDPVFEERVEAALREAAASASEKEES
jgi:cytochrome c biogenesis protein ResB